MVKLTLDDVLLYAEHKFSSGLSDPGKLRSPLSHFNSDGGRIGRSRRGEIPLEVLAEIVLSRVIESPLPLDIDLPVVVLCWSPKIQKCSSVCRVCYSTRT
jgi:hypothetical protein